MSKSALIIEDDEDLANIFSIAIQEAGFETRIIRDGLLAQAALKEEQPDIVVLDMHLPGLDGSVLLEIIRSDQRLKETRVMIVTADPLMADMYTNMADLVLVKPVSFVQLRDLASRLKMG